MSLGNVMTGTGAVLAFAGGTLLACTSSADQPAAPKTEVGAEAAGGEVADGSVDRAGGESEDLIAVTGRVVVTGSDPLVTLVIVTDANEQYELVGEQADPLWDLQQRQATVRGRVVREAAGPGFPAQLQVHSHTLTHRSR